MGTIFNYDLHDHKRHTARRIASTHSAAVLSRGGGGRGGYPSPGWEGTTPVLVGCTPVLSCLGGTPVLARGGTPVLGYPPPPAGTGVLSPDRTGLHPPPSWPGLGTPPPRKDLKPETWERTWDWGTPSLNRHTPVKT